ncbi:MAG: dihydrofolate reductase family protein, partial [Chloroflexota bacterium]
VIRDYVANALRALKEQEGRAILTDGSRTLVAELLRADLVDELHLVTFPLLVGAGKRPFPQDAHRIFTLESCRATPTGVAISHYTRRV